LNLLRIYILRYYSYITLRMMFYVAFKEAEQAVKYLYEWWTILHRLAIGLVLCSILLGNVCYSIWIMVNSNDHSVGIYSFFPL